MNHLSFSKIKTFQNCPHKYKWIFLDKKKYKHNKEYDEARFINSILSTYHFNLVYYKDFSKAIDLALHQKDWLWENIYSHALQSESLMKIEKIIMRYVDNVVLYIGDMAGVGFFPQFYLSELDLKIGGKFDLVMELFSGTGIGITDFKMGKKIIDDELWNMIYGYTIQEKFPAYDNYSIKRYYLEKELSMAVLIPDKQLAKEYIIDVSREVLEAKEFPCKKNAFCKSCYIKKINCCGVQ